MRETITVCLIGDDREREYDVAWLGWGEVGDESTCADRRLALVTSDSLVAEALVYRVGRGEWCSVNTLSIRDLRSSRGYELPTDERLRRAV
jgi:hypothetical protein